jgi:hypothetical protein
MTQAVYFFSPFFPEGGLEARFSFKRRYGMNKRGYYGGSFILIAGILFSGLFPSCAGSPSRDIKVTPGLAVKHALAGYENCFSCHSTGANDTPKYPANHAGRTNDMCAACHKIS